MIGVVKDRIIKNRKSKIAMILPKEHNYIIGHCLILKNFIRLNIIFLQYLMISKIKIKSKIQLIKQNKLIKKQQIK